MGRSSVTMAAVLLASVLATAAHAAVPVLVMPAEFTYYQMSAGGVVDALPDETSAARANLRTALTARLARGGGFQEVPLPELTPEEQAVVDEHLVLFDVVATDAALMRWGHKRNAFDYTIGPGLAFLADRSGAEKAVFVTGNAVSASGGRVAMALIAAVAVNAAIDTGGSSMIAGIVDLRSGAIEWADWVQGFGGHSSPATERGAAVVLDRVMQQYPNSRLYRARVQ